ncbi:MAG: hypothetical protein QOJ86_3279 [Bradyrhizobium sp.]|jgi:hypothetical protein|nr:hypothetical protein [Bradyrhizobium sp.]
MDKRKPSIPPSKFQNQSASGRISADIDPPPSGNDFPDGSPVAVYYRNEQEVSRGFLLALGAMARAEQLPATATPPGAPHPHEVNDRALNGAALSVEKTESSKED